VLASNLPVRNIYALLAVCPTIYAGCILVIGFLERRERKAAARNLPPAGMVAAGE